MARDLIDRTVVHPAVDSYIAEAAGFAQPILKSLREAVHEGAPGVVEEMKWSRPFFVFKGVILANLSAFKEHCSFGLWGHGKLPAEPSGFPKRITSVAELPLKKELVASIREAADAIAAGERTKAWSRPKKVGAEPEVPDELAAALKKNKAAEKVFHTKGAGWRREYCDWIADAKRLETRDKRVATALDWIAEGKGRNWKYEKGT
jgi:uncharacterized protein YdeI (YjbR/CyaY-like superfamily)